MSSYAIFGKSPRYVIMQNKSLTIKRVAHVISNISSDQIFIFLSHTREIIKAFHRDFNVSELFVLRK